MLLYGKDRRDSRTAIDVHTTGLTNTSFGGHVRNLPQYIIARQDSKKNSTYRKDSSSTC